MLVSIVFNIAVFSPVDRRAGLLLLPYLAWVTFASYLNFTLWRLNPDAATGRWCLLSDYFYLCSE
jgi:tryptophan-rich sensory protein